MQRVVQRTFSMKMLTRFERFKIDTSRAHEGVQFLNVVNHIIDMFCFGNSWCQMDNCLKGAIFFF